MPKELEEKLKREARKKGLTGERFNAYVYGNKTMQESMNGEKKEVKLKKQGRKGKGK
jgi:hypothetical protein